MKNVVFLNNPQPQDVLDSGKFYIGNSNITFFSDVFLFGANINGKDPDHPKLYYNNEIRAVIKQREKVIKPLQNKGIKVHLSYLGNHQEAGWSCPMKQETIMRLSSIMVRTVNKFKLDGINVNDEYSICAPTPDSLYSLLREIKANPSFFLEN